MKLQQIYELAVRLGMEADPRGKNAAAKALARNKKAYEKLDKKEQDFFDTESLTNPYADSRILFGDGALEVKKIMTGIDMEGDELLVAKHLGDVDAVVAHHPRGRALVGLEDVMHMQADVLNQYGMPINVAEGLLHKRISEVSRSLSPGNHYRAPRLAELLNMPYMCTHTVTDNLVFQFLKKLIEKEKPETVEEVLDMLHEIPEYTTARRDGVGPRIFAGKGKNRTGVIAVTEITGGTEGAHDIYEKMANAGVGTVIAMHQSEKHRQFAQEAHINVVIAGHMSSDSIGMNLFLDEVEKGGVEIVPASGLIRVSRNKKT